jgi:hypothetical protein
MGANAIEEQIMDTERQKYRPRNSRTILFALGSLAFLVPGAYMIKEQPVIGWFVTLFFGLGLIVFLIQIIPGSTELTLTKEGFEMTSLFRKGTIRWTEIESFNIGYIGGNKTIVFDFNERYKKHKTGKIISKGLSGSHGALPTTYGLKAKELLKILNEWKHQYGA